MSRFRARCVVLVMMLMVTSVVSSCSSDSQQHDSETFWSTFAGEAVMEVDSPQSMPDLFALSTVIVTGTIRDLSIDAQASAPLADVVVDVADVIGGEFTQSQVTVSLPLSSSDVDLESVRKSQPQTTYIWFLKQEGDRWYVASDVGVWGQRGDLQLTTVLDPALSVRVVPESATTVDEAYTYLNG